MAEKARDIILWNGQSYKVGKKKCSEVGWMCRGTAEWEMCEERS